MAKDSEIWQFAAARLRRGETVMLLVVTQSAGSSPGRTGFKMVVAGDEMRGSVGGGVMEMRLVEQAKLKIKNAELKIEAGIVVEQIHRKNSPNASGMICSGKQSVVFFKLAPAHLKTVREIIRRRANNGGRYLRITPTDFSVVRRGKSDLDFHFAVSANEFLYEEKLGFKNELFIVGGGHCALALSEIMSKMDFRISLFDDRADLNTLLENKFAHEKIIVESYEKIAEFIPSGANVYVVVMTLGFASDEIVIRKLMDRNFKYFGVLGSRAKMKVLLGNLAREGFAKGRLDRIRTPAGMPIGSRTPEEIAVSIAAEIIAVKNT